LFYNIVYFIVLFVFYSLSTNHGRVTPALTTGLFVGHELTVVLGKLAELITPQRALIHNNYIPAKAVFGVLPVHLVPVV